MRISKANLPTISRFHHIPGSGTNGQRFLKRFLISVGFAYDFAFCQNNGLSRLIPWKKTQKTINHPKFFGGKCQNIIQNYGSLIGPKMSKFWNSRKLRYEKIMSFWNDSVFSCIFGIIWWWKGGVRGRKKWNFGSSRNRPKSSGIDQESIISHFGIIKTP